MIRRRSLLFFWLLFLVSAQAYADAEFYGIQMRNEHVAKSLVLGEERLNSADVGRGPFFNKSIYATASLKEDAEQRVNFSVNIFNNSEGAIPADYQNRDYYLVTKDNKKYPLYDPEAQFDIDEIQPKTNVTFQPSLGNLVLSKKNIKMIVCSFDLGRVQLVLFPSSKREMIEKLAQPPIASLPPPDEPREGRRSLLNLFKGKKAGRADSSADTSLGVASGQHGVSQDERTLLNPETQQSFAWPQDNPTPNTRAAVSTEPTGGPVAEAIKNFVYVPASGLENAVGAIANPRDTAAMAESAPASGQAYVYEGAPRTDAQVLQYNPSYKFITFNAGQKDGLKKNMLIYVIRDGRTVAQARVKQIREGVAAASLIPDSIVSEVRAGDKISLA